METIKENITYSIVPYQYRKFYLFGKHITKYKVIQKSTLSLWIDPTYSNGGGDFIEDYEETMVAIFKSYAEALEFKVELESGILNTKN